MKILITGAIQYSEEHISRIQSMGHSVVWMQNEKDSLPIPYDEVDGVICNGLFLHHSIEKFTSLRYIQLTSAGLDRVPLEYIKAKGITIYNARGVYSIPMAEFALSSVLSIYKQAKHFGMSQERHCWNKHRGLRELYGKNVCIVGCGSVGEECAKRFSAMGCQVFGVDVLPREDENYVKIFPIDSLNEVLVYADVLILTLPLTEESRHIIGKEQLSLLPNDCVIVNISRGAIIDTNALANILREKDITAVLDVFEEEPLDENSLLWDMENAVITPHNSFVGENNSKRLYELIICNLK